MSESWWIVTALLTVACAIAGTLARYAYVGIMKTLMKIQDVLSSILQTLAKQEEKNENSASKFSVVDSRLGHLENEVSKVKDDLLIISVQHREFHNA